MLLISYRFINAMRFPGAGATRTDRLDRKTYEDGHIVGQRGIATCRRHSVDSVGLGVRERLRGQRSSRHYDGENSDESLAERRARLAASTAHMGSGFWRLHGW